MIVGVLAASLVVSVLLGLVGIKPAQASFFGKNGKIAFTSNQNGGVDIYTATPTSSTTTQLTKNQGNNNNPAFSSDGRRIVFQSDRDRGSYDIFAMNADGTNQVNLTKNLASSGENNYLPSVKLSDTSSAPDKITYTKLDWNGCARIMLASLTKDSIGDIAGIEPTSLAYLTGGCGDAKSVFSSFGDKIAFASNRDGNDQIYTIPSTPTGGEPASPTNLSNTPTALHDAPSMRPDAYITNAVKLLTFTRSNLDGSHKQIYEMDNEGKNQKNLSNNTHNDRYSTYSPDGKQLAFQSNRSGRWAIYTMASDGSSQEAITSSSTSWDSIAADWGPAPSRLKLTSYTPAYQKTPVPTSTKPTVTFSYNMDQSTLTSANIKLQIKTSDGWNDVDHAISYNSSTRTATVTPSARLKASKKYRVVVTSKVQDTLGTHFKATPDIDGDFTFNT